MSCYDVDYPLTPPSRCQGETLLMSLLTQYSPGNYLRFRSLINTTPPSIDISEFHRKTFDMVTIISFGLTLIYRLFGPVWNWLVTVATSRQL